MKKTVVAIASVLLLIVVVVAAVVMTNGFFAGYTNKNYSLHVGVTFGGDNPADAKQLIDKVKGYTNLFVVTSGSLQDNASELQDVCDYAVNSGLDVIVYFGSYGSQREKAASFIDIAQQRWGSHFLGVYYGDEPSGKAFDSSIRFDNVPGYGNVTVDPYALIIQQIHGSAMATTTFNYNFPIPGQITQEYSDYSSGGGGNITTYDPDGNVTFSRDDPANNANSGTWIYLRNGTVLKEISTPPQVFPDPFNENNGTEHIIWPTITYSAVTDMANISQFESYQQLWDSRPFQTMDDLSVIAKSYVETQQATTDWIRTQTNTTLFTADYVLPWWDYQSGYDTVFAELGWNNTVNQQIGLVRGAANLQNKTWDTIITWKYNQPPYLPSGAEMYSQMKASYEAGAKYVVVFNYAENMTSPYGTLQPEHFQALQRFWTNVVENPSVVNGGVKAEAALVLPADYGWGMRSQNDSIWGIWKPDNTTQQIWNLLQSKLAQYGPKLDIVYEDSAYPVTGKYTQIIYWNQTG